jgi:hypothetical protein
MAWPEDPEYRAMERGKQWSLKALLKTKTASLLLPYMMKSVERSAKN